MSLKELENKMINIVSNFHRYQEIPTMQNIVEFFNLFNEIINGIINLQITTTKDDILNEWKNNVTNNFHHLQEVSLNLTNTEKALIDGINKIETKEIEMIEDLKILQQLENHFNIPRAESETVELFRKFKELIRGIQQIHDKQSKS